MNLRPQRKNANKHSEHGLRLLEKSLQQDGWIDAQTVAADGEMISGSARLEVAGEKFADVEPIIVESDGTRPVIVKRTDIPNADDPRARRLSVAANQIAATDWNPDGELLKEWGNEDKDIRAMFADSEWEEVTGEEKPSKDAEPQIDRAAELLEKWQVKTGDLWQIGEHRLICGDCTNPAVVARVMGNEIADMVFTSPPYGSKTGNLSGKKFYGAKEKDTFEDYVGFLCDFLSISPVGVDSPVFVNLSYNDNQRSDLFRFAISEKHGFTLYETFIWKKLRSMPLKGDNISRLCEFVFLFSKGRYKIHTRDGINMGLFNFYETKAENMQNWESGNLASFPVDFPEHFIDLFSLSGFVVYEPFNGTGTTLVACQNLGRRGRAIEISPAYCAVTLERMAQAFPGIEIKRLE